MILRKYWMFWKKLKNFAKNVKYKYCCVFKVIMLQLTRTLNLVNLAILYKKNQTTIAKNTKTQALLILLLKLNIIVGWHLTRNPQTYIVYVNVSYPKKVLLLVKPTRKLFIKVKFINALQRSINANSVFLQTSGGFYSLAEAQKHNLGGILIFKLV